MKDINLSINDAVWSW